MTSVRTLTSGPDDLLIAAGQGDRDAFGAFYDRTIPLIYPLLRCGFADAGRAGEATERIYGGMWRAAPRFSAGEDCAYALLLAATRRELTAAGVAC